MNVSLHARAQLLGRMPAKAAVAIIAELEATGAPKESEARIIRRFAEQRTDGQSNGDVLLAIIERGTVVTVYWRRATQTFSAEQFRVKRFRDVTRTAAEAQALDAANHHAAITRLQKHFGGPK